MSSLAISHTFILFFFSESLNFEFFFFFVVVLDD